MLRMTITQSWGGSAKKEGIDKMFEVSNSV